MIITIGRECGCGGNTIGRMLADNYGIPFYDKKAIIEIAKKKGLVFSPGTEEKIMPIFEYGVKTSDFGNGRFARKVECFGSVSW